MALLRIVGLRQAAASRIVFIQVLLFTIPGIVLGLLLSVLCYVLLAYSLNKLLYLSLPYAPPTSSYVFSILVGLLSPFIAIIPPIVQLAKQKLVESLDLQHSVFGILIIINSRIQTVHELLWRTIEKHPSQLKWFFSGSSSRVLE